MLGCKHACYCTLLSNPIRPVLNPHKSYPHPLPQPKSPPPLPPLPSNPRYPLPLPPFPHSRPPQVFQGLMPASPRALPPNRCCPLTRLPNSHSHFPSAAPLPPPPLRRSSKG